MLHQSRNNLSPDVGVARGVGRGWGGSGGGRKGERNAPVEIVLELNFVSS